MDIVIEGNKLDFELEKENNVLEVVESIEGWLSQKYEVIDELTIDGNSVLPSEKDKLEGALVSETDVVEIKTLNHLEYAIHSLLELQDYLNRFVDRLNEDTKTEMDNDKKDEILDGLKWIHGILLNISRILHLDMNTVFVHNIPLSDIVTQNNVILVELDTYKYNLSVFEEIMETRLKANLIAIKDYVPKIMNNLVFRYTNPKDLTEEHICGNLEDVMNTIKAFIPRIPDIGTNLQAGKQLEAYMDIKNVLAMMEILVGHLRKLEELLKIKYSDLVVDKINVDQLNKEFNELLLQLSEAFTNNDIVLLGDLLEYELIDKLEIYLRIFQELIVLSKKKNFN